MLKALHQMHFPELAGCCRRLPWLLDTGRAETQSSRSALSLPPYTHIPTFLALGASSPRSFNMSGSEVAYPRAVPTPWLSTTPRWSSRRRRYIHPTLPGRNPDMFSCQAIDDVSRWKRECPGSSTFDCDYRCVGACHLFLRCGMRLNGVSLA